MKSFNTLLLSTILVAGVSSLLLLSDEPVKPTSAPRSFEQGNQAPQGVRPNQVTACMYVQHAEITSDGILHFVTENSGGTRYYFFNAQDRNTVIVESTEIEADQFRIENQEHGVLLITVPEGLNLDLERFGKPSTAAQPGSSKTAAR